MTSGIGLFHGALSTYAEGVERPVNFPCRKFTKPINEL
ncbi:MAG: hypothetical protein ACJAVK_003024, partial [Akkermansiaceae bacterium]